MLDVVFGADSHRVGNDFGRLFFGDFGHGPHRNLELQFIRKLG